MSFVLGLMLFDAITNMEDTDLMLNVSADKVKVGDTISITYGIFIRININSLWLCYSIYI